MYTCGPTVYGRPHIGNYSSFLLADLLRRWLETGHNYAVTHVKNITDVGHLLRDRDHGEDKVERQAKEEKGTKSVTSDDVLGIARKYEKQYREDEKKLNFIEPEHRPRATETIQEMIAMIELLFERDHAYETDDGVYFSVESFPAYGKLSGNTVEELQAGARIEVKEYKKHPADFALWKKCVGENADHILRWESPWGVGFPGWHIECSCMSKKFLGEQFDIHTGGEDLIFPHHECEIAQSECSGKSPSVRCWVHRRFIDIGGGKKSKSIGNVHSLSDIETMGYHPMDLRYYLLSVHYRTNLKFSEKGLNDAHVARRRVQEWIDNRGLSQYAGRVSEGESVPMMNSAEIDTSWKEFIDSMNDDLNTPAALSAVFKCMNYINANWGISSEAAVKVEKFSEMVSKTFGCFEQDAALPDNLQKLIDQREEARRQKNFTESDSLRVRIEEQGYEVRDTQNGQVIRRQ